MALILDVVVLSLRSAMRAYSELEYVNTWKAVDDNDGRRDEPGEGGLRQNQIYGNGRFEGDPVLDIFIFNKLQSFTSMSRLEKVFDF